MRWVVLVVVVIGFLGAYVSSLAGRIDRLHLRVQATLTALELQLARRAAICCDGPGPVAEAARLTRLAAQPDSEVAENALSRAVHLAWNDAWSPGVREAVVSVTERIRLAKQFHGAALTALQRHRRRRLVRALRIGGPEPQGYVEIDDTLPSP